MGWKNLKEHYGITHIVQVVKDKGICIGSGYVHDLIVVDPVKQTLSHNSICNMKSRGINDNLKAYWDAMHADLNKLWEVIATPDTFTKPIPVYTYDGGEIILKHCEELEWPNTTHDGEIMYNNTFFTERRDAVEKALVNAEIALKWQKEDFVRQQEKMAKTLADIEKTTADVDKLKGEMLAAEKETSKVLAEALEDAVKGLEMFTDKPHPMQDAALERYKKEKAL